MEFLRFAVLLFALSVTMYLARHKEEPIKPRSLQNSQGGKGYVYHLWEFMRPGAFLLKSVLHCNDG